MASTTTIHRFPPRSWSGGGGSSSDSSSSSSTSNNTSAVVRLQGHRGRVWACATAAAAPSPHGLRAATASEDGTVRVWDTAREPGPTSVKSLVLKGHTGLVSGVAVSADGHTLASSGYDRTARVWTVDAELGAAKETRKFTQHTDVVLGVSISADGSRVATTSMDRTVRVWSAATGETIKSLSASDLPESAYPRCVAISGSGSAVAAGWSDDVARVWSLDSDGDVVVDATHTIRGHLSEVRTLALSFDASVLVTGSADTSAIVWHAATGAKLVTLAGHTAAITGISLSADASWVATFSLFDGTVRLWDWRVSRLVCALQLHNNSKAHLRSMSLAPDKSAVVVGTDEKDAMVWRGACGAESATLALLGRRSVRSSSGSSCESAPLTLTRRFILDADGDHAVWSRVFGFMRWAL